MGMHAITARDKNLLSPVGGMTLIEIVLVIVLVSIAIVPLCTMYAQGVRGAIEMDYGTVANCLAAEKIEEIKTLAFASVGNSSGSFPAPFNDYAFSITVQYVNADFTVSAGSTNYKRVTVTVTHPSGINLALTTVMSNHA